MLNTVRKKLRRRSKSAESCTVRRCGRAVKEGVCYTRWTGTNAQLRPDLALHQKIETRFGIVCDVVGKFIKTAPNVYEHLDENTSKDFASISAYEDAIHGSTFLYLKTFVECYKPIRHI